MTHSKDPLSTMSTVSKTAQSKKYYLKFIHNQNRQEIKKQLEYRSQFIPFNEGSKISFEARFKHYMKQLTKEEDAENERVEREKQRKLQSNYNTQSILIQDNKDHL